MNQTGSSCTKGVQSRKQATSSTSGATTTGAYAARHMCCAVSESHIRSLYTPSNSRAQRTYCILPHICQMLTQRQKDALKRHAAHHTQAHMTYMRRRMHAGDTFSEAHRKALKHVGK